MKIRMICMTLVCALVFAMMPAGVYAKAKRTGKYPSQPGIILVTPDKYKNLIPTGHAAIVYNKNYVIESVAQGVIRGKNNWERRKSKIYGLRVKNTSAAQRKKASRWCEKKIGKKYNYDYFNTKTRSKFYCSHLIWAAYKDNYKIDLNTPAFARTKKVGRHKTVYQNPVHPMELVKSSKTATVYTFRR
jgi:uncharacterized protein YycO